jgi:cell division protein FtsQ
VLEPYVSRRFVNLPLVVGDRRRAAPRRFLAKLDRYPGSAQTKCAAVLVAERRWNLRLETASTSGCRKPASQALETLARLDREKKLLSRDITVVDLRLPDG